MFEQAQPERGVVRKTQIRLHLGDPRGLWAQIRVATFDGVVGELRRGHEIVVVSSGAVTFSAEAGGTTVPWLGRADGEGIPVDLIQSYAATKSAGTATSEPTA